MNHLAVDLGSRKSQVCIRSADGKVQEEMKVATKDLAAVLKSRAKSRVVLETSSEAFAVADVAIAAGHEVNVVPATLAPTLGVGQRGVKTDRKDALNLSMASCRMETLPSVHLPSAAAREQRAMITHRAVLVTLRTKSVNSVKGWARTQLLTIPGGKTSSFPSRAREAALAEPHGVPSYIERTLKVLEALNKQIAEADKELQELAEKNELTQRLMTTPGVGPVTSVSFHAAVDDIKRFSNAHALESYLGLTPGENSSGMKTHRLGITSAGPAKLRTALVQAAWCAWRSRSHDPMVVWAKKLATKKPKQVAIVALARKMAGILFALWRDGTTYNAAYSRAEQPTPQPPSEPQQLTA